MIAETCPADHHGVDHRQCQGDDHAQVDAGALVELGQGGGDLGGLGLRAAAEGIEHHVADELLGGVVQHQRDHDLAGVELHPEESGNGGPGGAQHDAQQNTDGQGPHPQPVADGRDAHQRHAQCAHQHLALAAQVAELGVERKGNAQAHQKQRREVHSHLADGGKGGQGPDEHIVVGFQRVSVHRQDQQGANQHGPGHAQKQNQGFSGPAQLLVMGQVFPEVRIESFFHTLPPIISRITSCGTACSGCTSPITAPR